MADDFDEEEGPRRKKKKGKGLFSRKITAIIIIAFAVFILGALFQHYYIEPVIGEGTTQQYAICLSQKGVLDERFSSCAQQLDAASNSRDECGLLLSQCTQNSQSPASSP
jgi:hypothetical protein